jgi:hypothetical protein
MSLEDDGDEPLLKLFAVGERMAEGAMFVFVVVVLSCCVRVCVRATRRLGKIVVFGAQGTSIGPKRRA